MTIARYTLLAVPLLCGAGTSAHAADPAESGATIIDAMRLEVYLDREMRAFGDAEIQRDGQVISGDRIDLNTINNEIHATGNVRVKQGDTLAEGPELRLKMDEREGEMTEPVFHIGGEDEKKARGNASTILFEGPIRERLKSARYTTCPDGVNDWFVRANELEINHHTETATATHASIEFMGLPILYTPWIDFPFSNQRKSGLLTATYGSTTRSGFEFALPYYWNIAPNMDATITPRYLSKRGLQWQGEYRYLDPNYNGIDLLEFLPSDDQTGKNRFLTNLTHSQKFGNGWSGSFQFERVSDPNYFSDLSTHITITSRVNLPQQANLRYDQENWHFSALAQQFQTLDKVSFPYQRLPQLTLTGQESIGPVDTTMWSEFVRFDKNSDAPLTVVGNRFTVYPSVSLPLLQSYGYITPKLGVHYTKYDLGGNTAFTNASGLADNFQSDTRVIPIFSLDSSVYFDRDMRVVKNLYTQTLEPRLFYVYIPHHDQSRLPNFDTGLSDLNLATIFAENQFAGGDRINDANQVTLALTSRLIDQKTGIQRLSATMAERFYFTDQNVVLPGGTPRTGMHSDFLTALTVQLINGWHGDAAWQYNTDTGQTVKGNIAARYQPEAGKTLNLAYRFTRDSLEQIDLSSEWPLTGNWYGLGRINYSLRNQSPIAAAPGVAAVAGDRRGPVEYIAGVEYDAGCWQGRAVMQRLPTVSTSSTVKPNYAFFMQIELGGLTKIGTSPLAVLKRNIPGYVSTSLIPDSPR